jgi:hypothetical protein
MGFIPWLFGSTISHHVVKQYIVDKVWTREKLLISSWHEKRQKETETVKESQREREREHEEKVWDKVSLQMHTPQWPTSSN